MLKRNLKFIKLAWRKKLLVADNCSVHRNATVKDFNIKNKIRCIEGQNYSPDYNPILNLKDSLKEKLSKINIKSSRNLKKK